MPSRTSQVRLSPCAVVLEDVDDAKALLVVVEAAGDEVVEDALAGVAEGRVSEIVAERDGLGQLLVEPAAPSRCSGRSATLRACA